MVPIQPVMIFSQLCIHQNLHKCLSMAKKWQALITKDLSYLQVLHPEIIKAFQSNKNAIIKCGRLS